MSGAIGFDENGDRVPPGVNSLEEFVDRAVKSGDLDGFVELGLVPCHVHDGALVNEFGPGAGAPP